MTLRVIIKTDNAGMAANVGGSVFVSYKTVDIEHPEIEAMLRENRGSYVHTQVVGVEILGDEAAS